MLALASESDETSRRSPPASQPIGTARCAGVAGTARWRKCGPAAERRANGVAFSADNRASDALRRLLEVVPRGLRRLWDGRPAPVTLAQFPARHHLAGKIRFRHPALYYNYPLFTGVMHLLGARLCSPHGWPSVVRGLSHWRRESAGPPLSRLSRTGEQLTQKSLARPLGTSTPRPTSHSHLTKRPAVARATAGKVLAAGCTRQGQSTRRGLSSPSTEWNTSTTWSVGRDSWPSLSSSWQRWCHLRPSRPDLALRRRR